MPSDLADAGLFAGAEHGGEGLNVCCCGRTLVLELFSLGTTGDQTNGQYASKKDR